MLVEKCGNFWDSILRFATGRERPADSVPGMRSGGAAEVRACSACAGDYEDPDRTAWTPDETGEDDGGGATDAAQEIPADQQ